MVEFEYDGSTTESETYDYDDDESDAAPSDDVKTESINILALGDALASPFPPQSFSVLPALTTAASSGVSTLQQQQEPTENTHARIKRELRVEKVAAVSDASVAASQPSNPKAVPAPAPLINAASMVQPIAQNDIDPMPHHPAQAECAHPLISAGDNAESTPEANKLQCSACKQIFLSQMYSKNQLSKSGKRRCATCILDQRKSCDLDNPLPLVCRACLKMVPYDEFSISQRANDATRRCKTCVETKFRGSTKQKKTRPLDARQAALQVETQSMFAREVAKIKMAFRALERKKAANDLSESSRIEYEEQLATEEHELMSRQSILKNRDSRTFDQVIARMQVKDAAVLGSESDKNVVKNKSLTIQKTKEADDTKKAKPPSVTSKGATILVKDAEKPAPTTKAAAKRSPAEAGLKDSLTPMKKPHVHKVKTTSSVGEREEAIPIAPRTKRVSTVVSTPQRIVPRVPTTDLTRPAPRRNPPRGQAKPHEVIDLTED